MIGLGVGIDYALFIVTRYRENLDGGLDPERSVVRALDTAGRAVLFAGTTVVISVLGLLLMKTSIMRGVAIGIAIGVLTTMLGVGHAAAGAARLRRPQHRQVRPPPPQAPGGRRSRSRAGPVEPRHPAPPVAGGDRRARCPARARGPAAVDAARLHRRRQPARRPTRRARRTTSSPRASGPGFNGPLLLAARDAGRRGRPRRAATSSPTTLNETQGRRVRHAAAGQRRGRRRGHAGVPHHRPAGQGDRRPRRPPARRRDPVGRRRPRST